MANRTAILAIETSNPGAGNGGSGSGGAGVSVGRIGEGGGVTLLGEEQLRPEARHDDALLPAIARLMERCRLEPGDLGRVAVSIGPGGYTSIRIGVTVAKMICEATGARCVPVHTAEAVHAGVDEAIRAQRSVAVCLAWKRESVWRAVSEAGGRLGEGGVVLLEEVLHGVGRGGCLVADDALVTMLKDRGVYRDDVLVFSPTFRAAMVMELGARGEAIDPLELLPLYPREPEAVTKWRQRLRG